MACYRDSFTYTEGALPQIYRQMRARATYMGGGGHPRQDESFASRRVTDKTAEPCSHCDDKEAHGYSQNFQQWPRVAHKRECGGAVAGRQVTCLSE
jgi:hypothetical protein